MRRYIIIGYLFFLSVSIGMMITLGALTAPVIFKSQLFISETISHFSEGLIMTEIFSRSNTVLLTLVIVIALYEGYDYKEGKRDMMVQSAALAVIFSALLFIYYYTPQIIELQTARDTEGELFKKIHVASEIDYKILLGASLLLVLRRFAALIQKR